MVNQLKGKNMSNTQFDDTVGFVMTKDPFTIGSSAPVSAALQTMIEHDIGSVIVVKTDSALEEPLGIITERDVTRRSLDPTKEMAIYDKPVSELMSQPLITVPPATPVWDAFEIMVTKKIRRLPVVDGRHLIGIVTERDLFKWVLRAFYQPNIPERLRKFLE
jgi:CBS domain-containing protein